MLICLNMVYCKKKNGSETMLTELTLGEKLKDLRVAKGFKNTDDLAKAVNIPKTTLNDYENDDKNQDVGYFNLVTLAKFYDVSMDWLLGLSSVEKHLNTAYSDLGLSDTAIDVLKSEYINSRLLSEIIEHPHFSDLMADIELYVDSIISMQISSVNSVAQTAKDKIKGEYNPSDKEYILRSLECAKIKEDRYFRSLIHEDIDLIADDIRKSHKSNKKDTSIANDENAGITILSNLLNKVSGLQGNKDEMMLQLIPVIFGVELHKLTNMERNTLKLLFQKGQKNLKKL